MKGWYSSISSNFNRQVCYAFFPTSRLYHFYTNLELVTHASPCTYLRIAECAGNFPDVGLGELGRPSHFDARHVDHSSCLCIQLF